jgi:hypothetical protein
LGESDVSDEVAAITKIKTGYGSLGPKPRMIADIDLVFIDPNFSQDIDALLLSWSCPKCKKVIYCFDKKKVRDVYGNDDYTEIKVTKWIKKEPEVWGNMVFNNGTLHCEAQGVLHSCNPKIPEKDVHFRLPDSLKKKDPILTVKKRPWSKVF